MSKNDTKFISLNRSRCIACWECIDICPAHVIGKVNFLWHKHAVLKNITACIGCRKCIKVCTQQAFSEL